MFRYEAPQAGPLPRALAVRRRGHRQRRPAARRRGHRAAGRHLPRASACRGCACASAAWATPRAAAPTARGWWTTSSGTLAALGADGAGAHARQPAAPLRHQGPAACAEVMAGRAEAARPPLARRPRPTASGCSPRSTRLGIAYEEDPTPGARLRLLHDDRLRVHQRPPGRPERASAGAGATTAWSRRSAGRPRPGIGFGAGIERIVLALEAVEGADERAGARLLPGGARRRPARCALLPLLERLRAAGLRCESDLRGREPEGHDAPRVDASGARHAVIVGPREHEDGVATVRDMDSGEQREVPLGRAGRGAERMIGAPRYRTHTCVGAAEAVGGARAGGRAGSTAGATTAGVVFIDLRDRCGHRSSSSSTPRTPPAGARRDAGSLSPEDVSASRARSWPARRETVNPAHPHRRASSCGSRHLEMLVRGRPAAVLGGGRVAGGLRGAAADLPLPRHPPARGACGPSRCAAGWRRRCAACSTTTASSRSRPPC